jgi:phage shock protein E
LLVTNVTFSSFVIFLFFSAKYFFMENLSELSKNPGATFIDVRSPEEFAEERLPAALNIPVEIITHHIYEINGMSSPVILYCRTGVRSAIAYQILKASGIKDVHNGGSMYDLRFEIQH